MSKRKATAISLPVSRTAKIMNSSVGVECVHPDVVALATKATELFLTDLALKAYELSPSNILDYDDIQELVHKDPRYDFLVDTAPKRIKYSEAMALHEEKLKNEPPPYIPMKPKKKKYKTKRNCDEEPTTEQNDTKPEKTDPQESDQQEPASEVPTASPPQAQPPPPPQSASTEPTSPPIAPLEESNSES